MATRDSGLSIGDTKLKVLWIEDKPDVVIQKLGTASRQVVELFGAKSPSEVRQHLRGSTPRFDVFITDFRLTDAPKPQNGRGQANASAVGGEAVEEEPGLYAPSAGFLIGLLYALNFPERPSVILPYSIYPEEFGEIWNLARTFAPTAVRIVNVNVVTKIQEPRVVISMASAEFRKAIIAWGDDGRITFRTDEIEAYRGKQADSLVAVNEGLTIITAQEARILNIGAIFLDADEIREDGVPARLVHEFLDQLSVQTEEEKSARVISQQFIKRAESELSEAMYERVYTQFDRGDPIYVERVPDHVPWLGVRQPDEGYSLLDRRNAFLFILVYIYARYALPSMLLEQLGHDDEDDLNISQAEDVIRKIYRLDIFGVVGNGLRELIASANLDGRTPLDEMLDELDRQRANLAGGERLLFQRLIQRYVNPCPENAEKIVPSIRAEGFIGKGLRRLLDYPRDSQTPEGSRNRLHSGVLAGPGFDGRPCLNTESLQVPLCYAREQLPPNSKWPSWLTPIASSATSTNSKMTPGA